MRSTWVMCRFLLLPFADLANQVGQQNTTCDERLVGFKSSGYRGCQTLTREGRTCMLWTVQLPHAHYQTPQNFPGKGLGDHNYCRNPDYQGDTIWCYTTDPNKQWEHCSPVQQIGQQNTAGAACSALTTPYTCGNLYLCIWDIDNALCQARYVLTTNGSCANPIIGGVSECSSAAAMLGLSNTTAKIDGQASAAYDPPYCYFEDGTLKYNDGGSNTGSCSSIDQCLCANMQATTTTTMVTAAAIATQVSSTSSEDTKDDGTIIVVAVAVGGAVALCVLVLAVIGVWRVTRRTNSKSNQKSNFLDPESYLPEENEAPASSLDFVGVGLQAPGVGLQTPNAAPAEDGFEPYSEFPEGAPAVMLDARASTLLQTLEADSGAAQQLSAQGEPQCIGNAAVPGSIHIVF